MHSLSAFLRRNWRSFFIGLAISIDTLAVIASASVVALLLKVVPFLPPVSPKFFVFFIIYSVPIVIIMGMLLGLYRSAFHSHERTENRIAAKAYLYSFLIILASFTAFKVTEYQRGFLFPFFLILPAFWMVGRALLRNFNIAMQERGFGIHKALIVGYENGGAKVFERFKGFPELGYEIRGLVSKHRIERRRRSAQMTGEFIPHYSMNDIEAVIRDEKIDRVFIPSPRFITNGYSELIRISKKRRIKVKVLSPEADSLLRMARIHDIAGITLYAPARPRVEFLRKFFKRSFDIVGSLALLFALSPVFVVTAVAICWESGFPIFFRQRRASIKGGKSFYFYKFRSMVRNADELKDSLLDKNEADGALFKLKNDPRMTKVGRFIRKYSIDELPQLFNVLKGDMSLVGPRPLPVGDFERVKEDAEFWEAIRDREKVKPGMTGLWQISGRSEIGFREMVLLDLYYIEHQSLLFDLEILFATIPVVLFGKGAY